MILNIFKKLFSDNEHETESNNPSEMKKDKKADSVTVSTSKANTHRVAGTSYRTKEIESLGVLNPNYSLSKSQMVKAKLFNEYIYQYTFKSSKIELIEEPDNEYDSNAVKVMIDGVHVGYIKKGSCTRIKKLINNNIITSITAKISGGKYKYIVSNGDEKYMSEYELERGTDNYSIKLTIQTNE